MSRPARVKIAPELTPVQRMAILQKGIEIEGDKIVGNLSPEPIVATVEAVSAAGAVTFDVRYLGVKLTKAACKVSNGKQIWTEVK